ncbi:MAG: endolytic transglycosylase MltG [Acidobacteriia bacterium]|nr:endolytic transglycosylase MltG [Terriglobia bacterium]
MRRLGLLALVAIAALGAGAGWLESQIGRPYRGHRPEKVFVDIPRGTSRWKIAGILRRNSIIRSRVAFALFSEWHFRHALEAGEYLFDRPVDSREVFWKITKGQIFVRTVTIPEGWTMYDVAGELERQELCSREEFLGVAQDPSPIADLAPQAKSLEGFLFPSTYKFTRHTSCAQIAKRMVQDFRTVWGTLGSGGPPELAAGWTPEQMVTLASLVERETPKPEERPLVAGVFCNRLRRGYPLQCDPTVQYAMELAGHAEKNVRAGDLRVDSPYNTYRHRGLPPGPIANPGEASLRAALAPAQTDFMYFVANDQGGHFFSRTLAEHNHNVARLRRLLAGDAPPPEAPKKSTTKPKPKTKPKKQRGHS